jgi:hypothetical protein
LDIVVGERRHTEPDRKQECEARGCKLSYMCHVSLP